MSYYDVDAILTDGEVRDPIISIFRKLHNRSKRG